MGRFNGGVLGQLNYPSSDSASGIWSLNEVSTYARNENWPIPTWEVNVADISYDSVAYAYTTETAPEGLAFSTDGTKMYIVGYSTDRVNQFTLSTAWDLSTASDDSVNFSIVSQEGTVRAVAFSKTGTKMYVVGNSADRVFQYTLSTAWDLSSASYDNVNFSIGSQDSVPLGLNFNDDGTKMYVAGNSADDIFQYTLGTAYDVSSASYDSALDITSLDTVVRDIIFSKTGTRAYVVGSGTRSVYQFSLSTGFDISTASYDSASFSFINEDNVPTSIKFSADGTKIYMLGYGRSVHQYSTGL